VIPPRKPSACAPICVCAGDVLTIIACGQLHHPIPPDPSTRTADSLPPNASVKSATLPATFEPAPAQAGPLDHRDKDYAEAPRRLTPF
jgi:hypothetical protein